MINDLDVKPEVGRLVGASWFFMYGDAEKRGSEPPLVALYFPLYIIDVFYTLFSSIYFLIGFFIWLFLNCIIKKKKTLIALSTMLP